jgi:hypothetical protein
MGSVGECGPAGQAPAGNRHPHVSTATGPQGHDSHRNEVPGRGAERQEAGRWLSPSPSPNTLTKLASGAPTPAQDASGGGLVTSAISGRVSDLGSLWAPRFPSPDLVQAAAAMYPGRSAWDGTEGPRPRITIAPGVLQLSRPDLAKRERTANRAADHRAHIADQRGLADEIWTPEKQAAIRDRCSAARGRIRAWSGRSRSRMVCRLAQLDWTPLTVPGRLPCMVTTTYPGDWLTVAPDRAAVDRHLRMLYRRWLRAWGEPLTGAWKFEFQRRGAPHWCAYAVTPQGFAGEWRQAASVRHKPAVGDGLPFAHWLRVVWADIVDHPDPEHHRRHQLAGTRVDFADGMRSSDPKRLAVYFTKHGQFRAKEYQNHPPKEWAGKSCGRFWGYRGMHLATAVAELDPVDYVMVTRTLRRYARAQGVTRLVQAPRARGGAARPSRRDVVGLAGAQLLDSHRVRRRTVRRRVRYLHRGAGFVCVNDGPALAAVLAQLIE